MRMLGIVIFGLIGVPLSGSAGQNTCHQADQYSAHFISAFNGMMGADDSAVRARFKLPLVDSAHITLVSDPVVCARAGRALDSIAQVLAPGGPPPAPNRMPLYVIQIGNSYAVADLNHPNKNHYSMVFVFGSLWQFLRLGGA